MVLHCRMPSARRRLVALTTLLLLAACGGGSGAAKPSPSPPPTPTPSPSPSFDLGAPALAFAGRHRGSWMNPDFHTKVTNLAVLTFNLPPPP